MLGLKLNHVSKRGPWLFVISPLGAAVGSFDVHITVAAASEGCCNIGYHSKTHLKLKSRDISFVHIIHICCRIVFKFSTEYDSIIPILCEKNAKLIGNCELS